MPDRSRSFPVKLGALWRQVFPVGTATVAVVTAAHWVTRTPFSSSTLPIAASAAVVVLVLYVLRPIKAGPDGLELLHRLGFRRHVAWADIVAVRFGFRHPLEPAFRIEDREGRVHWIPRHTKRLRELQRLTVEYGGATHPLARALETPICDAP